MKITGVELRRISMPLVAPFRTSFGTETDRDILLVRVVTPDAEGWGECVAMSDPLYSSEYVDGAADVLRRFLVPRAGRAGGRGRRTEVARPARAGSRATGWPRPRWRWPCSTPSCGRRAARSAASSARSTTACRAGSRSASWTRIPELLDAVGGYLDEGYVRIKLKIEPGWDVEPVRAVRERFGDDVLLQVDANTAYTLADAPQLARLDPFDLLLIEQPLDEEDVLGHADLAQLIRTPVCLDESIVSARDAAAAIRLGACRIVNIKPGRVGGYLEARRIHDVCVAARRAGVVRRHARDRARPGRQRRAGRAARASRCPATPRRRTATTPTDITEPFVLDDGHLAGARPGRASGVAPLPDRLAEVTTSTEWLPSDRRSDVDPADRSTPCARPPVGGYVGGGSRPRASLGRVLDDLGATLLDLAHGDADAPG